MQTVTSTTLLEAIKNGEDHCAWALFTNRYRPMIVSFAGRLGLNKADSEDVAQETLLAFLKSYREDQYNRQKGRLRSWLFSIARCNVIDLQRKKAREYAFHDNSNATGFLTGVESPDRLKAIWDEEWQRAIVQACLEEIARKVTPQTIEIFTLSVLKEWTVEAIVKHLGVTPNTVYIARNRVLKKFRELKEEMEEIW
jgi:RNA polymerase sigma-70 factor (ECF subfamily)